jgi:hypothetical protein
VADAIEACGLTLVLTSIWRDALFLFGGHLGQFYIHLLDAVQGQDCPTSIASDSVLQRTG